MDYQIFFRHVPFYDVDPTTKYEVVGPYQTSDIIALFYHETIAPKIADEQK